MEKQPRRPFVVTLLTYGVFLLGVGYLIQFGQGLSHYSLNRQLPLSVPAWYQPLSGVLWGGLWLVLAIGLWRRREWARRFTLVVIPLQVIFWSADWWLFSRSQIAIQSFGFDLGLRLTLAVLGVTVLVLAGRWETADKGKPPPAEEVRRESQ